MTPARAVVEAIRVSIIRYGLDAADPTTIWLPGMAKARVDEIMSQIDAALARAQAALGAGRECANPEQHRCAEYHALEDRLQAAAIEGETLESEITDLRARLAAVEAERDELKARNARQEQTLRFQADSQNVTMTPEHANELEEAADKADTLATALARYGRHDYVCQMATEHDGSYSLQGLGGKEKRRCTCGFDAAREG